MDGRIVYPKECKRNEKCQPYARIDGGEPPSSFFCVGNNGGRMAPVSEDIYTCCFKGEFRDDMVFLNKTDVLHQIYVLSAALVHIDLDEQEASHAK